MGTMHQYVLSMANRDPVFDNPNTLTRRAQNLDKMLGWTARRRPLPVPAICPGQELSVAVIHTVISPVKEVADANLGAGAFDVSHLRTTLMPRRARDL